MIDNIGPILSHFHLQTYSIQWLYSCTLFACFYWLERLTIRILTRSKCCSSPARVSLLYTCLDFVSFFLSFPFFFWHTCPNKNLNIVSFLPFLICLLLWCPAIQFTYPLLPHFLLHLARFLFLFLSLIVGLFVLCLMEFSLHSHYSCHLSV